MNSNQSLYKNRPLPWLNDIPHHIKSAREIFNINSEMEVAVLDIEDSHTPDIDANFHFDTDTTEAILAGFMHRRNVLLQGFHGTGKSSHIEQVAARLRWPLIRVNLDGHISRIDLIGRDAITLKDGKQVTEFQEGILPWALSHCCALLFDEYDAARPDVMFVLQRVLESEGKLTLLDQNRVITPHSGFRLFGTANTIGLGDATGLYHGTNPINQGHMDRWHIISTLNYLSPEDEATIIQAKVGHLEKTLIMQMVTLANLTRTAFANGDVCNMMSPRTVISWAENYQIFGQLDKAFKLSYLNKCDESEHNIIAELYQRVFNEQPFAKAA